MFKVCVIISISKIKFFNFSGTERVKNLAADAASLLECA